MAEPEQPPVRPERRCPICGKPTLQAYRPFCSARCRDVDLGHWFGERYAVPAAEPEEEPDEDAEEPGP